MTEPRSSVNPSDEADNGVIILKRSKSGTLSECIMLELAATALLDVFFHVELVRNLGEQHVRSDMAISVARWAIDQIRSLPSPLDGRRLVHD